MLKESQWTGLDTICIGPTMATGRRSALPDWREPHRPERLSWKGICPIPEPSWSTPLTGQGNRNIVYFIVCMKDTNSAASGS